MVLVLSTLHSASQVSYFFSFLIVSHWYPEQTLTVISADKLQSLEITHETLKLLRRMHGCTHTAWRAAGHLQQAHSKYPRKVFYSINRHRKWYIHFSNITTNYKCSSLLKCLFLKKGLSSIPFLEAKPSSRYWKCTHVPYLREEASHTLHPIPASSP